MLNLLFEHLVSQAECDGEDYQCRRRECSLDFTTPLLPNCSSQSDFVTLTLLRRAHLYNLCNKDSKDRGKRFVKEPPQPAHNMSASDFKSVQQRLFKNMSQFITQTSANISQDAATWPPSEPPSKPVETTQKQSVQQDRVEMFYYDKLHYGWCPVYKSCSSRVNSFFCPLYYNQTYCEKQPGAYIWRHKLPNFKIPGTLKDWPWKDIKTFIVVRDPFSRILSAYRDKLENFRPDQLFGSNKALVNLIFDGLIAPRRFIGYQHQGYDKYQKAKLLNIAKRKAYIRYTMPHKARDTDPNNPYETPLYATFPEFIGGILSGTMNEHWAPASLYCTPCRYEYDYIIKADHFSCEFNHFLNITGHPELIHNNNNQWASNTGPAKSETALYEYYSLLSDTQLELFYKLYQQDCELFDFNCREIMCKIKAWKEMHHTDGL